MSDRPIILGIVGDSAAGKTTLTRGIAQILGAENVTVIVPMITIGTIEFSGQN